MGVAETRGGNNPADELNEVIQLVKTYAKQETIGPLRSTGRFLGYGLAGGFLLSLGVILMLIGLLRLLQTETDVFEDGWSFVPYFIVVIVGGVVAALFATRIQKDGLDG